MAVRLVVRHPKSAAGGAGEISFEFEQARVVIGRGPGADVRLPDCSVSETHATIEQQGSHYALRDEGSTNGTSVNDVPLVTSRPRLLSDGDVIDIAGFLLSFFEGPLHRGATSPERTASLARRMLRELLGGDHEASAAPCLRIIQGAEQGTVLNFGEPPSRLVIGRGDDADLVLTDVDVSRAHLELVRDLDGVTGRDLESKNGLEVNGKRMRERRLRHGDVIRVGSTSLVYEDEAERALRELERLPDVTRTRTNAREPAASAHEAASSTPAEEPAAEREPAGEPPSESADGEVTRAPVDMLIYALAVVVFISSLVGLAWLFG